MIKKIYLLATIAILAITNSYAQDEEIIVEEEVEYEVAEDEDDFIQIDGVRYEIKIIHGNYNFYYKKQGNPYNKKYGIVKNKKRLLPNLFISNGNGYGNIGSNIILVLNGFYNIYNLDSEKWLLKFDNKRITKLNSSLFAVQKDNKFAIFDADNNKFITPFEWASVSTIYSLNNYFIFKKGNYTNRKYGLYNAVLRKLVIPCDYQSIENLNQSNLFLVKKNDLFNIIDLNKGLIFKNWYESIKARKDIYIVKKDGKMGIIDINEVETVPIEYKFIANSSYSDGSYLAKNKNDKYGCINSTGKITLPFKYKNIKQSNQSSKILISNNDKCGILRINDNVPYEVVTCEYNNIDIISDFFIVEKNNKFGLLSISGKEILQPEYTKITNIINKHNAKIFVATKNNKAILVNNGIVSPTKYKDIKKLTNQSLYSSFSDKYIAVKDKSNRYGLIDKTGTEIVPCQFEDITKLLSNKLIIIKKNNKLGVYDIIKNSIVIPTEYNDIILEKSGNFTGFKDQGIDNIILGNKTTIQHY